MNENHKSSKDIRYDNIQNICNISSIPCTINLTSLEKIFINCSQLQTKYDGIRFIHSSDQYQESDLIKKAF